MTSFPSSIISFSTKVNGQTIDANDINSPQNEITALETKVGIDNSSVIASLDYLLKNPLSSGGGHVQAANVGGTGQTSYNKGDVLVATSTSVLSKLSAATDGLVLGYDSTTATGLKAIAVLTAPVVQNQQFTYARASVMSASVYGVNLTQAVSVLSDGLGLVVKFPTTNISSVLALSVNATGPSSVAARIKNTDGTNPIVGAIQASMIGVLEFDSVSSIFQLQNTYVPTYGTDQTKFLRNDATFAAITNKIYVNSSVVAVGPNSTASNPFATFTTPGSVLGTNGAINIRCYIDTFAKTDTTNTFSITCVYGGSTIINFNQFIGNATTFSAYKGYVDITISANASTGAQLATAELRIASVDVSTTAGNLVGYWQQITGTAAVDSGAAQTTTVNAQFFGSAAGNTISCRQTVVKGIV